MRGMQVWFLGQEDSLEEETAPYLTLFAWRIWLIEEPGRLQSIGAHTGLAIMHSDQSSVDINIVQQSCWCPTDIPLAFNVFYTKGSLSTSGTCDLALDFLAGGESLDHAWVGHQHPVLTIWWWMGICGSV